MLKSVRNAGKGLRSMFSEKEAFALFKLLALLVILMFVPPIILAGIAGVFIFGYLAYRIFD